MGSESTIVSDSKTVWDLMKTDNGIILACFVAGVLSLSPEDLQNPVCSVLCILICAILIGGLIASICPEELKPYVASILIGAAGIGLIYRVFFNVKAKKHPLIFFQMQ